MDGGLTVRPTSVVTQAASVRQDAAPVRDAVPTSLAPSQAVTAAAKTNEVRQDALQSAQRRSLLCSQDRPRCPQPRGDLPGARRPIPARRAPDSRRSDAPAARLQSRARERRDPRTRPTRAPTSKPDLPNLRLLKRKGAFLRPYFTIALHHAADGKCFISLSISPQFGKFINPAALPIVQPRVRKSGRS